MKKNTVSNTITNTVTIFIPGILGYRIISVHALPRILLSLCFSFYMYIPANCLRCAILKRA